jgi:hypothetical protein
MALKRISDLTAATLPLAGTEEVELDVAGASRKCSAQDIADLAMANPMTTAGDIITGDVSGAPQRLPAGTNGQVLTIVAGVPTWASGGGGGAMTLIASATVSGSAVTTVTISGLDLLADGFYQVIFSLLNASGSSPAISLFYNADTTATNYNNQTQVSSNTSTTAARVNNGRIFEVAASSYVTGTIAITRDVSGRPRAVCDANRDEPSAISIQRSVHIRANTANVTSITFSSSVASSIGIGSTFKVFKIS